jgi:hypothetical protein
MRSQYTDGFATRCLARKGRAARFDFDNEDNQSRIVARLDERESIAIDLHDNSMHSLYGSRVSSGEPCVPRTRWGRLVAEYWPRRRTGRDCPYGEPSDSTSTMDGDGHPRQLDQRQRHAARRVRRNRWVCG